MTFARFSRNQEVSVYYRKAYNTVWKIQPSSGIREDRQGEPVRADESIILEHAATANYLTNDHIKYQNTFGSELEVSCMAQSTKNKT
jgi:dolichyl-phosphate-mannose--protein O-mannosyl transferase